MAFKWWRLVRHTTFRLKLGLMSHGEQLITITWSMAQHLICIFKLKAPDRCTQLLITNVSRQTDKWTDGRYQTYYLPSFTVDNNIPHPPYYTKLITHHTILYNNLLKLVRFQVNKIPQSRISHSPFISVIKLCMPWTKCHTFGSFNIKRSNLLNVRA